MKKEEEYWQEFLKTGTVESYLHYKRAQDDTMTFSVHSVRQGDGQPAPSHTPRNGGSLSM